jgi:hypothetical protein
MAAILIQEQTASSDSTIDFTTGIDSTYKAYEIHLIDIHPSTDNAVLGFQMNESGQTGFNEIITSVFGQMYHNEADFGAAWTVDASYDQQQGTAYQPLLRGIGNDTDQCGSGILRIEDPSSTSMAKHFMFQGNMTNNGEYSIDCFVSGYFNVVGHPALDEISFKMNTGNIDSGTFKLYGIQ